LCVETGLKTDGACKGNPGPGGWAYLILPDTIKRGGSAQTTNNQMELCAILEAIQTVPANSNVELYTDSELCINWLTGRWKRNIPAIDKMVREIMTLVEQRNISLSLHKVKGHDGDENNTIVDAAASQTATEWQRRQRQSTRP